MAGLVEAVCRHRQRHVVEARERPLCGNGKATLIQLDQLEIVKVRYFESSADLRSALDELPSKAVGNMAP
jgi:hypothetical protein